MSALTLRDADLPLADWLADRAVDALIDEADLTPKPGLVDRRGSGAHTDLHLGLMHASALSLWPCFRQMAEAALQHGEVGVPLREALGRIGREGEAAMLATTAGVNTHRGPSGPSACWWRPGRWSPTAATPAPSPCGPRASP